MAKASLRFGVVGLGFGAEVHVPGLRSIPDVEVAALAGTTYEKARRVADALGIPGAAAGYEALGELGLDAVTVALPPKTSQHAVEYFVSRGIPVLCEKPLAADASAAARLAAAVRAPSAVDFQFPELEAFRAARRAIEEGALGPLRHVQLTWLVESLANRSDTLTWKTAAADAGGVMSLLMPHALYNVMWLHSPVARVYARMAATSRRSNDGGARAADTVHFTATLRDGTLFGGVVSNASPGVPVHRWTFVGERGSLTLENLSRDYMAGFAARLDAPREPARILCDVPAPTRADGRIAPFASLAARFVDCVRSGAAVRPSFAEGLHVQLAIEAMCASSRTGEEHEVDSGPVAV